MAAPLLRIIGLPSLVPSGGLVIDSNGNSLNYIGKAAVQTVTQPTVGANTGTTGDVSYLVNRGAETFCVPFITVPAGRVVYPISVAAAVVSSVNKWRIVIHCGGTPSSSGFLTQYSDAEVFCFARLTTASGIGLKLKDAAGVLTHVYTDTDGRPLVVRSTINQSGADFTDQPVASDILKPAFYGFPVSQRTAFTSLGGGLYRNTAYEFGWERGSVANTVRQADALKAATVDDGPVSVATTGLSSSTQPP